MSAPAAPPKKFKGECPKCNQLAEHEEFFRERRMAKSTQAVARMDFKAVEEYSFRCLACGNRNEKILDTAGTLHKWTGNRHTMLHVGSD